MRIYEGDLADSYEQVRQGSAQWKFEQFSVEKILRKYNPERVMDIPVGTGRFFDVCKEIGCEFIGVDVSDYMLQIAKSKKSGFKLIKGDYFIIDLWEFLVVMRFWGHMKPVRRKIDLLKRVKKHIVISHREDVVDVFKLVGLKVVESHKMKQKPYYVSLLCR